MDCLPWFKNDTTVNLEEECRNISYCKFQSIDNNDIVPSCYIDETKFTTTITNQEETELGFYYLIESNNGRATQKIRIDFEFLDDNTLRFKVKNGYLTFWNSSLEFFINFFLHSDI